MRDKSERERERETDRQTEREREKEREACERQEEERARAGPRWKTGRMNSPLYPEIGFLRLTIWEIVGRLKKYRGYIGAKEEKTGRLSGRGGQFPRTARNRWPAVESRIGSWTAEKVNKGAKPGARNEAFLWPVARINSRLIVKLNSPPPRLPIISYLPGFA